MKKPNLKQVQAALIAKGAFLPLLAFFVTSTYAQSRCLFCGQVDGIHPWEVKNLLIP